MRKLLLFLLLLAKGVAVHAQVYSVVEESTTDVEYISATQMVCRERRVITVLDKKGLHAADFQVSRVFLSCDALHEELQKRTVCQVERCAAQPCGYGTGAQAD